MELLLITGILIIELGDQLAEFSKNKFKNYEKFNVKNVAFQDFQCNHDLFDLIYSASAFHWIPEDIGYTKVFDMLKGGGVITLYDTIDLQMLKHISEQVTNTVKLVLKSNVIGVYLTGSAVLGDWHYGKSDIDFTVIVNNSISKANITLLEKQIKPLEAKYSNVKLEI